MIIDAILDRQEGSIYNAESVEYIVEEAKVFELNDIVNAFTAKYKNKGVEQYEKRRALILYIANNEYSLDIIPYILSVNW